MLQLYPSARAALPGLWAWGLVVRNLKEAHCEPLPEAVTVLPVGLSLDGLKDDQTAAGFRKVSWSVGIDPTKNRPSGEALARRILAGKPLPDILPLVDAYNLASAATLVPIGAYDLEHLEPPLTIRPARGGERFHGIGRDPEPLPKGRIVYADANERILGVLLWRDAMETRVRATSERVLLMTVGADPVPATAGREALHVAANYARKVGFQAEGEPVAAS